MWPSLQESVQSLQAPSCSVIDPITNMASLPTVVLFTTALFLSGYAIQQRTVKNLRAAIRPDNTPQLYLPDRFHDDTTELADGTIVMLDEYNRPVRMKNGRLSVGQAEPQPVVSSSEEGSKDGVVIEIAETLPEILGEEEEEEERPEQEQVEESSGGEQQEQKVLAGEEMGDTNAATVGEEGQKVEQSTQQQEEQEQQPPPSPPSEESQEQESKPQQPELAEGLVLNPNDETQKPISRAERRRLIKEEIARLSQGNQPVYYQRRLW